MHLTTNIVCLLALWCIGQSSAINIGNEQVTKLSHRATSPTCPRAPQYTCDPTSPFRSINGACNNLQQPWWGQSNSPYKRLLAALYDDRLTEPRTRSASNRHSYLPNARSVANGVFDDSSKPSKWTWWDLLLPYFAQLVSYDLSATAPSINRNGTVEKCRCNSRDRDCFSIPTPKDDKKCKDQKCMSMVRSLASVREFDCSLGPREQLNKATHWLDLSFLYGSTQEQADNLRSFTGGELKSFNNTRTGELYFSLNPTEQCKYSKYAPRIFERQLCYVTGDPRTEDNAVLTSLVTIFLREHNRIAKELSTINPLWTDERLYQETRRIVIAIYQNIVYSEFMPAVIGKEASISFGLPPLQTGYFTKYTSSVYPQVNNEFATAASRFFHTMLPLEQNLVARNNRDKVSKSFSFFQFNNQVYERQMTPIIRGLLTDTPLTVKPNMNKYLQDWLWNELFYDEETKRWSLSALNIQQGRDHGLAGYNKYRRLCGLREAKSFNDLTNIPDKIVQRLKKVYSSVDDIDLFVGLVSEKPLRNALVGQTAACIIGKQFRDLKFGDRFYFENGNTTVAKRSISKRDIANTIGQVSFKIDQLLEIRRVTMIQLIAQNTNVDNTPVQPYAFYKPTGPNRPTTEATSNQLNLSLWFNPQDLVVNCSDLFTIEPTTGTFNYSVANTSANFAAFQLSYTAYESSGLTESTVDIRCFPLNRTVILTITGNSQSTNLVLDSFAVSTDDASVLVYINNMNTASICSLGSNSVNNSTFAMNVFAIQDQISFCDATLEVSEQSKLLFNLDWANKVDITGEVEISVFGNSSVNQTITNVIKLTHGDKLVFLTDSESPGVNASQTQANVTLILSTISEVAMDSIKTKPSAGGYIDILIENVELLTFANSVKFKPQGSLPPALASINTQITFSVLDVGNATFDMIEVIYEETSDVTVLFENIGKLEILDSFQVESNLSDPNALSNTAVTFSKIAYAHLSNFTLDQTNSGKLKLDMIYIGVLEQYVDVEFNGSSRIADVAVNYSTISNATLGGIELIVVSDGVLSLNMEKIGHLNVTGQLGTYSEMTTNLTRLYVRLVDIVEAVIDEIDFLSNGGFSDLLLDRIQLTTNNLFVEANWPQQPTVDNNTLVISNSEQFKVNEFFVVNCMAGTSSAQVFNITDLNCEYLALSSGEDASGYLLVKDISQFEIFGISILSSSNETARADFGPGIDTLQPQLLLFESDTNESFIDMSLYNFTLFQVTDRVSLITSSPVNVSLYSVDNTTIGNVTALFNTPQAVISFNLYDLSDVFDILALEVPAWADVEVKTVEKPGCDCSAVGLVGFP